MQSGSDIGRESGHVPPQHQTALVPLESSLLSGKDHLSADMGAFMGRSFRVGWGPGWRFVHGGPKLTPTMMEEEDDLRIVKENALSVPSPASFLFMGAAHSQPRMTATADAPRLGWNKNTSYVIIRISHLVTFFSYSLLSNKLIDHMHDPPDFFCSCGFYFPDWICLISFL